MTGRRRQEDSLPELNVLLRSGYDLAVAGKNPEACDTWLEAWNLVKELHTPTMTSVHDFDARFNPAMGISNWLQLLETELLNASVRAWNRAEEFNRVLVRFVDEYFELFPDDHGPDSFNLICAKAEGLWRLGQRDAAEAIFREMTELIPDSAWSWIRWADMYHFGVRDPRPDQLERAEEILKKALARPDLTDSVVEVWERLALVYERWGRTEEQKNAEAECNRLRGAESGVNTTPATPQEPVKKAVKLGRNDPCSCGSGKKYKKCHLAEDEKRS